MPRPMPRPGRPANRPGQTRGGRRGRLEAFERQAEAGSVATLDKPAEVVPIELASAITVSDLAARLGVSPSQVIKALFTNGIIATINQVLDYDTAAIVSSDLGFEVREQGSVVESTVEAPAAETPDGVASQTPAEPPEDEALLKPRPCVVTVMGHVDHGKTSLLDAIRQTRVAAGEAGGITQHIGAYQAQVGDRKITFIDTPGHQAFTAMRARGAQVTDIAVIVVAADDGVMPQTREAVDHARAAGVPIILAINKIDRPDAQPDRIKQELADYNLVVTDYGGTTEAINVSARTGEGVQNLLETILLVSDAEVQPRANPDRPAEGVVIEAKLDKSRGAVATALVKKGTLRVGDVVVAGMAYGKVKALFDDTGGRLQEAPPAYPAEILGLTGVPAAGDRVRVVADERVARALVEMAQRGRPREEMELSAEAVFARIRTGTATELNLVVKADVQGSLEPLVSSVEHIETGQDIRAKVIHAGLGNVNVNDVNLSVASGAMIIAFNVRVENDARRAAELNKVSIREHNIIYALIEEMEKILTGMLEPRFEEAVQGHAEVRATFRSGKRTIAGCFVTDGTVHRRNRVRVRRGAEVLWDGAMGSLKRFKDDANEVREGFECGIALDGFDDVQVGDVLEVYSNERV